MSRDSSTLLAPGFRFHPTDEELVSYYLKRKVSGKAFRFHAISDVDVYKCEPWDLPDKSRLKSRDQEWYFFSALDRKYGNGSRTNRATDKGYWKTTGKDRAVRHGPNTVGMKKTLVYHLGRAPRGERTNWVMHEYKLVDVEAEKIGVSPQDAFVVCRIFRKSGTGPKNGEQYGAPFVEEDWNDDDVEVMVPGQADAPAPVDDVYLEGNEISQNLDRIMLPQHAPLPLSVYGDQVNDNNDESRNLFQSNENPFVGAGMNYMGEQLPDDQKLFDLPIDDDTAVYAVKDECLMEQVDVMNSVDVNYLLDEPYLDATEYLLEDAKPESNEGFVEHSNTMNSADANLLPENSYLDAMDDLVFDDGLFLETNDLANPVDADSSGVGLLDEYLAYLDADGDGSPFAVLDSSTPSRTENQYISQASLDQEEIISIQNEQGSMASHQLPRAHADDGASTSYQNLEAERLSSESKYPFIRQASRMLGNIHAPPAFASELLSKDVILRKNSAMHSSSPVHVTAGLIQVPEMTLSGVRMNWSYDKNGNVNLLLSLVLPQVDMNLRNTEPVGSFLSAKSMSALPWSWFYVFFFLALLLSLCYKAGSCICVR